MSLLIKDGNNTTQTLATTIIDGEHYPRQRVQIEDDVSLPVDFRLSQTINNTDTLLSPPVVNSYEVIMSPGHGFSGGERIAIAEEFSGLLRYMTAVVKSVAVDTLTISQPVPVPFTVAAVVTEYSLGMNVNGSVTPEMFNIVNSSSRVAHVTRISLHMASASNMDDGTFGSLPQLANGILFRKKYLDGTYQNYFTSVTNGELNEISGTDVTYNSKAPGGTFGLGCRITFNGPDKRGVAIELLPGESIEMVINDDLTGLSSFSTIASGHVVSN